MPNDLILVRHGQSQGNIATNASKKGDDSYYNEAFINTPGHQWRLSDTGIKQANVIGKWLEKNLKQADKYYVSPYVRTRETAACLELTGAQWRLNRALRERDWGDIDKLPRSDFEKRPEYKLSAWAKEHDPLYWRAPGGESIAQIAEDRVQNILATLHRESSGQKVIAVCHGEIMWAFRVVLERLNDEEYTKLEEDKTQKIPNCAVLHYSRLDPHTGIQNKYLKWVKRTVPVLKEGTWTVEEGAWREIIFKTYSNQDLLDSIKNVPHLF